MPDTLAFLSERAPELWFRLGQHILLTGASTVMAILVGVPLGVVAARSPALRHLITGVTGVLQTVPSLALLALLLALLNRIGTTPALIALVLYALLPIVRNTLTGLTHLPEAVLEAADGLGMTRWQRLRIVELPLAMPVILTGVRTAAVACVGIATLSAFIGAGGLGQFINRGLSLSNHRLILLGAIPSALLAMAVDGSVGVMLWSLRRRPAPGQNRIWYRMTRLLPLLLPLAILTVGIWTAGRPATRHGNGADTITIGSKNFTEQLIVGEIMAQWIERETALTVKRQFDLGGTMICHQALTQGALDLYAEYTGTGWTAILEKSTPTDPAQVYPLVAKTYRERFDLVWLRPFGFNNTYAITVRKADAETQGWNDISDLREDAAKLRAGWTFEFSERSDGAPGLRTAYDLVFGEVLDLESTLMYQAIAKNKVDVVSAFATDGRLLAYNLKTLRDDRHFFPPYHAAPVIRGDTLRRHPELRSVLNRLEGRLTDELMRQLNGSVDSGEMTPREAAARYLETL